MERELNSVANILREAMWRSSGVYKVSRILEQVPSASERMEARLTDMMPPPVVPITPEPTYHINLIETDGRND